MKSNKIRDSVVIIGWMIFSCLVMQYVEMVIAPGYWIKAFIKMIVFFLVPIAYCSLHPEIHAKWLARPVRIKDIRVALVLGIGCVVSVLLGYLVIRPFLDEAQILSLLGGSAGVTVLNFIPVAVYIAFVNSFIEEFFFRGFGYLVLKRNLNPIASTIISSLCFSLYHIGIIDGWFNPILSVLAVAGLAIVGAFFNYMDSKKDSIFPSWIVHLFCNLAINIVGLILFQVIKI